MASFVIPTTEAAPLETRETCDTVESVMAPRSNAHCMARPGNPTNGVPSTRRSNHRFTVTIGHDPVRDAFDSTCLIGAGTSSNSARMAYQGTADTTACARISRPPLVLTPTARPPSTMTRARALATIPPPRAST